jgi:hypothetical protein
MRPSHIFWRFDHDPRVEGEFPIVHTAATISGSSESSNECPHGFVSQGWCVCGHARCQHFVNDARPDVDYGCTIFDCSCGRFVEPSSGHVCYSDRIATIAFLIAVLSMTGGFVAAFIMGGGLVEMLRILASWSVLGSVVASSVYYVWR